MNIVGTQASPGAGMAVTVAIKTGDRRILENLFSPVRVVTSGALKEW